LPVAWPAWLVDLLFPARCLGCGRQADLLCSRCRSSLRALSGPCCALCGAPTAWPVERCSECSGRRLAFASARAAVEYSGPARSLVHGWKERGLRRAATLAADLIVSLVEAPTVDVVTPVPPDAERLLRRGHHPPERLARELARRWELPVSALLVRPRLSPRQTGLRLVERRRNVVGAFAARAAVPPAVLLVDDVYTTGATVSAAAAALRVGGARTVRVLTFARTGR
jgi:predicted amidophosphoribosyltransferase